MNTMLDKALSAALEAISARDEVGDDDMRAALRAALLAIREPDQPQIDMVARLTAKHGPDGYVTNEQARERWAALIDTLLI